MSKSEDMPSHAYADIFTNLKMYRYVVMYRYHEMYRYLVLTW